MSKKDKKLADLLFEAAMLKRIERTGYSFLGSGKECVASHSFGVGFTAWLLSSMYKKEGKTVDQEKVIKMALLHDFTEARTGDFNAVNKLYNSTDEEKALKDAFSESLLEDEVFELWREYRKMDSLEAKIVHDADVIDLIVQLKEQMDLGNPYAEKWINYAKRRLVTELGKKLAKAVLSREWCDWWYEVLP